MTRQIQNTHSCILSQFGLEVLEDKITPKRFFLLSPFFMVPAGVREGAVLQHSATPEWQNNNKKK